MNQSLSNWVRDSDALRHMEHFRVAQAGTEFLHLRTRTDDFYIALVGALFEQMRATSVSPAEWARLGNALGQFAAADQLEKLKRLGVNRSEALLFASAAFYFGGFPASAYLTIRGQSPVEGDEQTLGACFDLIGRPLTPSSAVVSRMLDALGRGDLPVLEQVSAEAAQASTAALVEGPAKWIGARLFEQLVARFRTTNVRSVLPDGGSDFWTPLVTSFIKRSPPAWEFFPSQIQAIQRGLLAGSTTFSLQMPTGAGKTALCETLLFHHAQTNPEQAAILLVPYRSLASELRATLVRQLGDMGVPSRCAYGGTVPSGEETRDLDEVRVMVATPETLSGLLSADSEFLRRVSMVICDEGHLLDSGGRGVGLELLLARLRAKEGGAPRFVFVSAIVPNIEEINAWLGGQADTVVRSDYRPALAEFAVLRPTGTRASSPVELVMHPHEPEPTRFAIQEFLRREDFQFTNAETGRRNTYQFGSVRTQAVAAARKALSMGTAVVFAANKHGDQGAVGLAEELLEQLETGLPLPRPRDVADAGRLDSAVEYLRFEYGDDWITTRALHAGAVLHHGDIPQETREVVERVLRTEAAKFAICTNTLAEGVNLPIRTLVLYSIERRQKEGFPEPFLTRDIKNLVGRAGRAGSTTKGLVICANPNQWERVEQVARQAAGEPVRGALGTLIENLGGFLAQQNVALSDQLLEGSPVLHQLTDGVDATLIDLAVEEVGEAALVQLATALADQTLAAQRANAQTRTLLRNVFALRARRVAVANAAGRLGWVRETGARLRTIDAVEAALVGAVPNWDEIEDPCSPPLVEAVIRWAWAQPESQVAVREAFRLPDDGATEPCLAPFLLMVRAWLAGRRFREIAVDSGLELDAVLRIHAGLLSFVIQTQVEQGLALLGRILEARDQELSAAAPRLAEHLRFGVPSPAALDLASGGVRHRSAAVALAPELESSFGMALRDRRELFADARRVLLADQRAWRSRLGVLAFDNTLGDLTAVAGPDRDG